MPRIPRVVVPGHPHHITQRGSRRQPTFYDDTDYLAYLDLVRETKTTAGAAIWAYCLMPNHVHLLAAVSHVELNPVRAGLCERAEDWRWSSVNAHLGHAANGIVDAAPMHRRVADWRKYLAISDPPETIETLRSHSSTGRPAGSGEFLEVLERMTGRRLRKRKPGPKGRS